MNKEKAGDLYTSERFEAQLDAALRRQPLIAPPSYFSANVAARAEREAGREARRRFVPRRPSWGGAMTVASLALLLLLMFGFARLAPGPVPAVAEWTLASEFLALLFGLLYLPRLIR